MKIYTRGGDKGMTSLFGGTRISKASVRLHAYGTLDELNAYLGAAIADVQLPKGLKDQLTEIQLFLFEMGADLATPLESGANVPRTDASFAEKMEKWIDVMDTTLTPLTNFILPGGSTVGAKLHEARTVARRAERWIVELLNIEPITGDIVIVVNRLSDYLFVAARYANKMLGIPENIVEIKKPQQTASQNSRTRKTEK